MQNYDYILITHDDLDGAGCSIVFNKHFEELDTKVYNCNVVDCGNAIKDIYENHKDINGSLIIADITPKEQEDLYLLGELSCNVYILDHHETAEQRFEELIIPKNVHFKFMCNKECGTKMLYKFLLANGHDSFINIIDDYDRFVLQYPESVEMNKLFSLLGMDKFVKRGMRSKFTDKELTMLETVNMIDKKYIKEKLESIKYIKIRDKLVATIFTDSRLTSMIAKEIRDKLIICDGLAVINPNTNQVSLRAISDDFHCGNFARMFDKKGGGHQGAGGFRLTMNFFNLVEDVLK